MSARIDQTIAPLTRVDVSRVDDDTFEIMVTSFEGDGIAIRGSRNELAAFADRAHRAIMSGLELV